MYRVSPFTYLASGLLSTSIANADVHCASFELRSIQPPVGQTCGQYLAEYMMFAGGTVYNPNATENCEFCSLANTDQYLASVNVFYSDRWRNFGLMWVYILFNATAAVFFYWLARVPKKTQEKNEKNKDGISPLSGFLFVLQNCLVIVEGKLIKFSRHVRQREAPIPHPTKT
jgi:ATP-binding cassette subfamily G (WHITE) protein 2 (PDR)